MLFLSSLLYAFTSLFATAFKVCKCIQADSNFLFCSDHMTNTIQDKKYSQPYDCNKLRGVCIYFTTTTLLGCLLFLGAELNAKIKINNNSKK